MASDGAEEQSPSLCTTLCAAVRSETGAKTISCCVRNLCIAWIIATGLAMLPGIFMAVVTGKLPPKRGGYRDFTRSDYPDTVLPTGPAVVLDERHDVCASAVRPHIHEDGQTIYLRASGCDLSSWDKAERAPIAAYSRHMANSVLERLRALEPGARPQRVLMVGFGGGVMAGAVLCDGAVGGRVGRVTAIDSSAPILELASSRFLPSIFSGDCAQRRGRLALLRGDGLNPRALLLDRPSLAAAAAGADQSSSRHTGDGSRSSSRRCTGDSPSGSAHTTAAAAGAAYCADRADGSGRADAGAGRVDTVAVAAVVADE